MSHIKQITAFILFLSIGILIAPYQASAFGVSPPFIKQNKLIPGSHFEKTIHLTRSKTAKDQSVEAEFDLPEEIESWFSIDKGEEFVIPAGVKQFPIVVNIDVPKDTELGIYKGFLRVKTKPEKTDLETTGASIAVGARIDINLSVGDDIIVGFQIHRIDILDIKQGDPIQALVLFENTGNVSVGPSRATLELFDKYGGVRLGFTQTEDIPKIPSFKEERLIIEFPAPLKLGIGEYWANVRLFREGKEIGNQRTIFNVTEKKTSPFLYVGIGAALVALFGGSIFVRRRFLK